MARAPRCASVVVELRGISKSFPGIRAVDRVDLDLRAGEVHCLLGENGAGKTTLMNVLAGVLHPDEGVVCVNGRPAAIDRPRDALRLGIAMVRQHSGLVPTFTVLENLLLGRGQGLRLRADEVRADLAELSTLLGVTVDPQAKAGRLSLGEQQQVQILRALAQRPRVLILDEPTSMLTPQGFDDLLRVVVRLKHRGLAVVFITHKLREAFAAGDRISVLRRGRLQSTLDEAALESTPQDELSRIVLDLMFPDEAVADGRAADAGRGGDAAGRPRRQESGPALLELRDVVVPGQHGEVGITEPLSLTLRAGEVLGVAGVDGNGQRPLAEAIAGQRRVTGGDIRLDGDSIVDLDVAARQRRGLRYVTDDRLGEGIAGRLSVALNLVSKRIGSPPFWVHGRTMRAAIEGHARAVVSEYRIATPSVDTSAGSLSGGNIQKVIVGRELAFAPKVVVFSKPTHGLDVRTTATVRARIRSLVEPGAAAALVISTDLEELLELSDRVAVLAHGRLAGVVENTTGAERAIGELMVEGRRDE
jgi:simple sugar transport system ATP-binding protein